MNKESPFQLVKLPVIKDLKFSTASNILENKKPKINISIKGNSKRVENKNEAIIELDLELKTLEADFFELNAKIVANCSWNNGVTEKEISAFLDVTAPALMLSYIRPVISNITTYAGVPPFIIPLLDLRK